MISNEATFLYNPKAIFHRPSKDDIRLGKLEMFSLAQMGPVVKPVWSYEAVTSKIILPKEYLMALAPIKKEREVQPPPKPSFLFFKDFQDLIERESSQQTQVVSEIGRVSEVVVLPGLVGQLLYTDALDMIYNLSEHLKTALTPCSLTDCEHLFDIVQNVDVKPNLSIWISKLEHKYFLCLKAFTSHIRRIMLGAPDINRSSMYAMFAHLLFRGKYPLPNTIKVFNSLPSTAQGSLENISIGDTQPSEISNLGLSIENAIIPNPLVNEAMAFNSSLKSSSEFQSTIPPLESLNVLGDLHSVTVNEVIMTMDEPTPDANILVTQNSSQPKITMISNLPLNPILEDPSTVHYQLLNNKLPSLSSLSGLSINPLVVLPLIKSNGPTISMESCQSEANVMQTSYSSPSQILAQDLEDYIILDPEIMILFPKDEIPSFLESEIVWSPWAVCLQTMIENWNAMFGFEESHYQK